MRGISTTKRATNQQSPKKKSPRKWIKFKRDMRNIRRFIMDAFRNARSIVDINKKLQGLERKLNTSLEISSEMEVKHRKSINIKLLLLLGLWVLDKVIIIILIKFFYV
jgi:hypothetical protein